MKLDYILGSFLCILGSTWLHAAVNHDFCRAGGCDFKELREMIGKLEVKKLKI